MSEHRRPVNKFHLVLPISPETLPIELILKSPKTWQTLCGDKQIAMLHNTVSGYGDAISVKQMESSNLLLFRLILKTIDLFAALLGKVIWR